jgi:hypothetical protein
MNREILLKVQQSLDRPRGFQDVEVPRFQDEVVRLSTVLPVTFISPGNIRGYYFC